MINFLTDSKVATAATFIASICTIIGYICCEKFRERIKHFLSFSKYILYLLPHFLFATYDFFKKNNEKKEILLEIEKSVRSYDRSATKVTNREIFDKLGFSSKLFDYYSSLLIDNEDLNKIKDYVKKSF